MRGQLDAGGHELPSVFSSESTRRTRRSRRALWISLTLLVALVAAGGGQLAANLGYDAARDDFTDAADITAQAQGELAEGTESLRAMTAAADEIVRADTGSLLPPASNEALGAEIVEADGVAEKAADLAATDLPDVGEKPSWPWELLGETTRLQQDTADLEDTADDAAKRQGEVEDASSALDDASVSGVQEAAAAAGGFEAAHVNARNPEIIALREAAALAASAVDAQDAADRFLALESAAAAVLSTEAAELAEKKGPLEDERVEIEAFARDLAPGLLLDFDWSATVPGYDGPSYGGWTTWWYADPGYATIALSDYIAEEWPAAWAKALVAHEVGHAISVKCPTAYDSSDQDVIEEWATAWAIGMGFTDDGNGTAVYGEPSQAMIDAAATCR
ncbi:hypothetical protein ACWGJP_10095 [Microbacterium sp. NPDC055903]